MSVQPVKPSEISKLKRDTFPDYVFSAVNYCIAQKYTNGKANILQKDIIERMIIEANSDTVDKNFIFKSGYLNFEEVYREAGWDVKYDKPAYNESYDAFFVFKGN